MDFNGGPGKEGSATITFLDNQPVYLNWYIWNLDREWMYQQIEQQIGKFKISNISGGNGHEGADIELISH